MPPFFFRFILVCITVVVLLSGCEIKQSPSSSRVDPNSPPPLQVAICDINEIAKELGLIDELNRMLTRERTLLDNEIRKLQATRETDLEAKIKTFGEFPNDEQKRELAVMQAQARQIVMQAQNRATRIFATTQENLILQIRTIIKKPVDQVASRKGIHIVLTDRDEAVLYTANIANITPEVLSAARNANLGKLQDPLGKSTGNRYQEKTDTSGPELQETNPENE